MLTLKFLWGISQENVADYHGKAFVYLKKITSKEILSNEEKRSQYTRKVTKFSWIFSSFSASKIHG